MTGNKTTFLGNVRQRSVRVAATVFLLPALLFIAVYVVYPIINSFAVSTMEWNILRGVKKSVGFSNWAKLIKDANFWKAFVNNIKIMFMSLLIQVPFAMILATFLDASRRKASLFKVVWFIPYLLSSVVIGVLFKFILDANYGFFASISKLMGGGAVDLLGNPKTALYTVIGVICWQYIPFYMLIYLAAYGTIPSELYEAASMDGATRNQYFWHISLPLLRPAVVSGMTLSIVGSLKYFDLIYVITGGGPGMTTELMATYMYRISFDRFNIGYGSAVASGMFILITLVAFISIKVINRKTEV